MKSRRSFVVAALLLISFCAAAQNTNNGTLLWQSDRIKATLSSLALDEDDSILYAGGSDGRLYAFDQFDGTLIYDEGFKVGNGRCSTPLIGPDGTVYVALGDGSLVAVTNAFDVPGIQWRYRTGGATVGSPAIDEDGTVYIGSKDNRLHAIPSDQGTNSHATNIWTFDAKNDITSPPIVT